MKVQVMRNESSKINLVFLSGGPGLSSLSFMPLKKLESSFNLHFLDPMGTNSELSVEPTYQNLLNEIESYIQDIPNVILCGHSFGGIQAVEIASKDNSNILGVIAIGSPVSQKAFKVLNKNFDVELTQEQMELSKKLQDAPTDEIYKDWFFAYRDFYFNPATSSESISVITDDNVCVKSYSSAIMESSTKEDCLKALKSKRILKLFITGEVDKVLPPSSAKYEAELGGFDLKVIESAGHFAHYECPKETMNVIMGFLSKMGGIK